MAAGVNKAVVIKPTQSCQQLMLHATPSATPAQLVPHLLFMGHRLMSQALLVQEMVLMLGTFGHKGTGLKPPRHFTQAIEQPSDGNDFPSLLTWTRLEPGN